MDHVCCCYSRFVDFWELESIPDNNSVLIAVLETYILHCCDLDLCDCYSGSFNFCHNFLTCISGGRKHTFCISNKMSQLCCQYYLARLNDLRSTEKAVIARAHLVITTLKLWPNNNFNLGSYKGIRGHFVFMSQNLGRLLALFPLKMTSMDDVVRVVWAGKTLSQPEQLSRFIIIWKHRIIGAL